MSKTKERIRESGLRYKQSLGQNFLYDENLLAALAESASLNPEEDVLEIGPGCGSLTKHLCGAARNVLAVELDERLIPLLTAFMAEQKNLTVVQGDIMALDLEELTKDLSSPFAVAANIPYYITTPLIQRLLSSGLNISRLALMVQKEVAEKILSSPGDEGWGPLAIRCQYLCEPYLAMDVPAACFTPPPKVDSAFVVMPVRKEPAVKVRSEEMFFRVAAAAFALRRKTMANNLCATFRASREQALGWMKKAGLDEKIRGERLTLEELGRLADVICDEGDCSA
ncbi:MAG: 16S rRNA (adenine(1518)-N(6)/adenine(1519)-N(6))-dimethyltransferase RsmA [Clostridiales bacterium]|nr:16S rRNA (adenine(1518)-N(6)/adenine(1519)-N(6))-dimethyltransferase RsmA [Clostridiales bacterium]